MNSSIKRRLNVIDELMKELKELQEYKYKYECQKKDKERMSNMLFELMTERYNNQTYEERCELHKKEMCECCRFYVGCDMRNNLPEDIWEPRESDKAWIPSHTTCGNFEWS